eukprot:11327672-Alexandrium_andersonii.AAC.1
MQYCARVSKRCVVCFQARRQRRLRPRLPSGFGVAMLRFSGPEPRLPATPTCAAKPSASPATSSSSPQRRRTSGARSMPATHIALEPSDPASGPISPPRSTPSGARSWSPLGPRSQSGGHPRGSRLQVRRNHPVRGQAYA